MVNIASLVYHICRVFSKPQQSCENAQNVLDFWYSFPEEDHYYAKSCVDAFALARLLHLSPDSGKIPACPETDSRMVDAPPLAGIEHSGILALSGTRPTARQTVGSHFPVDRNNFSGNPATAA